MKAFRLTKRTALTLVALLAVLLTACNGNGGGSEGGTSGGDTVQPEAAAPAANAGTDSTSEPQAVNTTEHVNLKMILLGDADPDTKLVYEELNKLAKRDLNATVEVQFLSFSDYQQRYPLLFATGETVDLIYTSDWAFYDQEAVKGAFAEVTEEILQTYMPQTWEHQNPLSFEQAKIGGKAYFVPISLTPTAGASGVLIRGDLREKYGLPEIKSIDDLEAYYDAVAKNEKGIYPFAASKNNDTMRDLFVKTMNELVVLKNGTSDYYHPYTGDADVRAEDLQWLHASDAYEAFVHKMKDWADRGFWSKNAVANNTAPRDAFENGTSASLLWNIGTLAVTQQTVEKTHPEWKPEIYDLTEGKKLMIGSYTSDGMAVAAGSKHKERAFMLLDKMKFDEEYNNLMRLGIKRKHWNPVGEDQWEPGPDQEKYRFGTGGSWGVKGEHERVATTQPPIVKEIAASRESRTVQPVSLGLRIDERAIASEMAAINSAKTKYLPLLELGLVDDVDQWLEEYRTAAKQAGQEKVFAEVKAQLGAYLDSVK